MTIKDRIQQYIDFKGISIYRLEADACLSKGYWGKTKNISADIAMKISRIYTDISADWLLRGEGEMLKQSADSINNRIKGNFIDSTFVGGDNKGNINKNISRNTDLESEIIRLKEEIMVLKTQIEEKNHFIRLLLEKK